VNDNFLASLGTFSWHNLVSRRFLAPTRNKTPLINRPFYVLSYATMLILPHSRVEMRIAFDSNLRVVGAFLPATSFPTPRCICGKTLAPLTHSHRCRTQRSLEASTTPRAGVHSGNSALLTPRTAKGFDSMVPFHAGPK
jgi:hypothetical protein